jgi:hypothetical protein
MALSVRVRAAPPGNEARRAESSPPIRAGAAAPRAELRSQLMPRLLEGLGSDRVCAILDAGPAQSATIEFFSGFRCRLYCADLFDPPVAAGAEPQTYGERVVKAFEDFIRHSGAHQFDMCLLWGMLNYLDRRTLQSFARALTPHTHRGTRAHAFVAIKAAAAAPMLYGIREPGVLTCSATTPAEHPAPCAAYSQMELKKLMRAFDVERGVLLRDGMMELLFHRI